MRLRSLFLICFIVPLYSSERFTFRTGVSEDSASFSFDEKEYGKSVKDMLKRHKSKAVRFSVTTEDGVKVPALFFDRNSDKLMVMGQGFPGRKEWIAWKACLFPQYDVVFLDYRWHSLKNLLKPSALVRPISTLFYKEKLEVKAVVEHLKAAKHYTEVIGCCECYSNLIFAGLQASAESKGESVFDKLIMDSCLFSLQDFFKQFVFNPFLSFYPYTMQTPAWIKKILACPMVRELLSGMLWVSVPHVSIAYYLHNIKKTKILFLHGSKDVIVPMDVFEKIWKETYRGSWSLDVACLGKKKDCGNKKFLLITPLGHVESLMSMAAVIACEAFIQYNGGNFETCLMDTFKDVRGFYG